jgi:hypothetical protein
MALRAIWPVTTRRCAEHLGTLPSRLSPCAIPDLVPQVSTYAQQAAQGVARP